MDLTAVPMAVKGIISIVSTLALCGYFLFAIPQSFHSQKEKTIMILVCGPVVWLFLGIACLMKKFKILYPVARS